MESPRRVSLTMWVTVWLSTLLPGLGGCAILNGFLDPTKVGQFPKEYRERGIRRILTPRDTPPGLPNATEPTPEDLVPVYEEYRLTNGDVVRVVILDLLVSGAPEELLLEVSSIGNIRVPQIGTIRVAGLTELELEDEIKARLRDAGLLTEPDVRVYLQGRRQRVFTIRGAVGRAGQYPIPEPDTRLLDAIGLSMDIGPSVQKMYVIRRGASSLGEASDELAPTETPDTDGLVIPPPSEDEDFQMYAGQGPATRDLPVATPPGETEIKRSDLEEVLAQGQTSRPAEAEVSEEEEQPFAPLVFDPQTGELVESEPGPGWTEPPPADARPESYAEEPFDWDDVPDVELDQRVIEIDVRALLAGDPRYNIVIRERDVINVPIDTGLFYLMGEVNRPGVYSFNGRDITIKQAVAMASGMSSLAWPQRCEIIRHEPGTDKQITIPVNLDAVFAGLEDDVYLRDDDIVNVGTHFVAPFLFVIRNSFRFTYGFGFVYDRNFADKDAYGARVNPQTRADQQRQQQGLPF